MNRRQFVELLAASAALPIRTAEQSQQILRRAIPSSGERIPVIGMGTWRMFGAGCSEGDRTRLPAVLQAFFDRGGQLINSSPMYGRSRM